jgi:preprotein translocase subunit SecY
MANPLVDIFRTKELRDRILFTIGILVIYRLGTVLPVPGVSVAALKLHYDALGSSGSLGIEDFLDFFAGGAFKNFSIFMLTIMPYISMSIIMQLLTIVFPKLKKIQEEEGGKKKINRWTRYGTVVVCIIQSYTVTIYANSIPEAIMISKLSFTLLSMLTITAGTMFLMWLGDQITRRGIGNGISMIIFAGIVARIPGAFWTLIQQVNQRMLNPVYVIIVLALWVIVIALVIMEQQGQRKIPVHYAKRVIGRRMYGAQNTYLPFKVNPSGVIPVIFASSVLIFPVQIAQNLGAKIEWLSRFAAWLRPNGVWYEIFYAILIIFLKSKATAISLGGKSPIFRASSTS